MYEDMLHLPRPTSPTRARMSMIDRAAQFSSFAALVGYEAQVKETARLTESERILDESEMERLDGKLRRIAEFLSQRPEITATYFEPDARKAGGAYRTVTGIPFKVDSYNQLLILEDETVIPFAKIQYLSGEIFTKPITGSQQECYCEQPEEQGGNP